MGTIADLMVHIGADTHDLESGFDRAGRAVGGMAKIVMAATVAGAAAIGAAAKIGIEYNSQMENYTTNMKVLLGSQDEAVSKMQELKDMAASTPFELSGLADATQTLLAFQVPAEETTGILKMLGDVSLGDSQKLAGLAVVFGQVSSAGKLQGQDLMQMINQGFNPLNYIAERTGESMAELRDRMSDGKIAAWEVTQAFQDATSAGGEFYNGMAEASKTMTGLISTLKDNARSLVGEVFVPISDGIKNTLLPQAIGYIDDLTAAFRENGVEGLVEAAGQILSSVVTTIAEGAPRFTELAVSLVGSLLNGITDNLPTIVDSAVEVASTLINGIVNMFPQIVEAGIEIIIQLANGVAEALPELVPSIVDAVILITETLIDHIGEIVDAGINIVMALVEGINSAIPEIVDAIPKIVSEIVAKIPEVMPALVDAGVALFVSLVSNMPDIINGILSAIPEIVDNIATSLTSKANQDKMGEAGKTLLSSFWNNIWTGFQEDWQKFLADPWGGPGSKTYAAAMQDNTYTGDGEPGGGGRSGKSRLTTVITPYATGGNPAPGELFFADENNVYEFKGTAGGVPTVANNSQMEEAVASGNRDVVYVLEQILNAINRQGSNGGIDIDSLNRALRSTRYDTVAGRSLA